VSYSQETRYYLLLAFGTSNMYIWRSRRNGVSKRNFRASDTSRWNSRFQGLIPLGLAIEREFEGQRVFSPTILAIDLLVQMISDPINSRWDFERKSIFHEIRTSFIQAPDKETRIIIENNWKQIYESEYGKPLPPSMSFSYLLN